MEDDMDATKTGEAFDPRTLDLKARDTCTCTCYICMFDLKVRDGWCMRIAC